MSIYPVRLSEWYKPGSDQRLIARGILSYSWCAMCGKVPPFKSAIASHALAYGYYDEIFCNSRCQKEYLDLRLSLIEKIWKW